MATTAYTAIRQAILNKMQVACTYHGYPRECCPHVIGTSDGHEQVLMFQFGGQSASSLPSGGEWRCMLVSEISNIRVKTGPWHAGSSHTKPQSCVKFVDVQAVG